MARLNENLSDSGTIFTSRDLVRGDLYSREDLTTAYRISDATVNTGVYRPPGKKSIWLFVTEIKGLDKTQYVDKLVGDTLTWQGQTSGRTDRVISDHAKNGDELVVFYRKHKSAFPGYGFRYEGTFRFESQNGTRPTTFVLSRT